MRAAVLGSPISHSLSPVLHRAGYGALGLTDWTYDRFELVADELPTFLSGLDASWRGLSLTMPLKAACLEVAEVVTDRARRAGVGNTLVRLPSRGWLADNTDVAGLVAALAPVWHPGWTRAAILGAGATARSAILALAELGVREVVIYARTPAKAEPLVAWSPGELAVSVRPLEAWTRGAEPVVISTLPGGAADTLAFPRSAPAELCEERPDTPQPVPEGAGDERAHPQSVPVAAGEEWPGVLQSVAEVAGEARAHPQSVPEEAGEERAGRHEGPPPAPHLESAGLGARRRPFVTRSLVPRDRSSGSVSTRSLVPREGSSGSVSTRLLFDAVYADWPTPLAKAAHAAGWTVVGGLDLLVHQAALQFELFTGHQAPIEAMFAAGRAALGQPS